MSDTDLEFLAEMLADREVMRYFPVPLSRSRAVLWIERQVERYAQDGLGYWLLVERESLRPIGQAGLMTLDVEGTPRLGLGYMIHRPHWRRGYAVEAARACLAHAAELPSRPRVACLVRPANASSRKVACKLGFEPRRMVRFANYAHILYELPPDAR